MTGVNPTEAGWLGVWWPGVSTNSLRFKSGVAALRRMIPVGRPTSGEMRKSSGLKAPAGLGLGLGLPPNARAAGVKRVRVGVGPAKLMDSCCGPGGEGREKGSGSA